MITNQNNNTTYLKFDKNRMVNLEYSLDREILRTNRRGAYHCTTLVECNTRKQHGLLVVPIPELDDSNHVLLSSLDETVIQHGAEFNLGIHKYDGNNYNPNGHKYIREFSCESLPKTIYRVGGVVLAKEKMFSLKNNTIFIKYTLLDAHSPTTMRFRPFVAFRGINELTGENSVASLGYKEEDRGISMCMYKGYPNLYMQFNKENKFVFDPHWNKGIEYIQDQLDGVPYKEDLYVPGYFEFPIQKGETVLFAASDMPIDPDGLETRFENGIKNRTPRSSFFNCLKNSGNQFFYRPSDNELYLLDNYPWGKVSARQQFFAVSGLTLCVGGNQAYEDVVDTAAPYIKQMINGESTTSRYLKDLDAPDVLFWLNRSLKLYSEIDKERFLKKYAKLLINNVRFMLDNKHPNLEVLPNGLVSISSGKQSFWLTEPASGAGTVGHRTGCIVELNSFWYSSLMFAADVALWTADTKTAEKMQAAADKVKKSFLETFINDAGYLYDYVDGNYVDWNVRPFMLFAVASDYPLLEKRLCKSILDTITKELLTPKGLRSLSPKGIGFKPRYEGGSYDKLYCMLNGAAWPCLFGTYMEAYLKVFQRSGYSFLDRLLIGMEEEMANNCIGSVSEVYDGSLPYKGHGAVSSAINIAGMLRAVTLQQSLDYNY